MAIIIYAIEFMDNNQKQHKKREKKILKRKNENIRRIAISSIVTRIRYANA